MKSRSLYLLALLLFLALLALMWFRRSLSPGNESLGEGREDLEGVVPAEVTDEIVVTSSNESAPDDRSDMRSSTGRSATLNPIPFERLSVSDVEEMDLAGEEGVHSHKLREWRGRIEPRLSELNALIEREGENGVLALSLPDASQVNVSRLRFQSFGSNQGAITGKILGDAFGEVVLSYVNQAVAGSIRDYRNENVWEIRNAGNGMQYLALVDVEALGRCGVCAEHSR